eukprot:Sspe_Gene.81044::Locus_51585_Transcript_1_1_Confidence_1.000_Length_3535::g.81044::m.81044
MAVSQADQPLGDDKTSSFQETIREGSSVEVLWEGHWYKATVVKLDLANRIASIVWTDGTKELVSIDLVRAASVPSIGEEVEAFGLIADTSLNGKRGVVVGQGRNGLTVQFPSPHGRCRMLPKNLSPVFHAKEDPPDAHLSSPVDPSSPCSPGHMNGRGPSPIITTTNSSFLLFQNCSSNNMDKLDDTVMDRNMNATEAVQSGGTLSPHYVRDRSGNAWGQKDDALGESVNELRWSQFAKGNMRDTDPWVERRASSAPSLDGRKANTVRVRGEMRRRARIQGHRPSIVANSPSEGQLQTTLKDLTHSFSSFGIDAQPQEAAEKAPVWTPPGIGGSLRKKKGLLRALGRPRMCGVEEEDVDRDHALQNRAIVITILSIAGLLVSLVYLFYSEAVDGYSVTATSTNVALQCCTSGLTLAVVAALLEYHIQAYRFDQVLDCTVSFMWGAHGWEDALIRGRCIPMVTEVVLHLLHPIPIWWRRESIVICCIMFVRIYTLVRLIGLFSAAYSHRFDILDQPHLRGKYTEVHVGWQTALKVILVYYTFSFFILSSVVLLACCAAMVYIAEKEAQPDAFSHFGDAIWFTFITYTTIGYGDIFPRTDLGRVVTIVAGVMGVIVANLFAAILAVKLQPTPVENEIIKYLDRLKRAKERYLTAVRLLQLYWRDRREAKRYGVWDYLPGAQTANLYVWVSPNTRRAVLMARRARLRQLEVSGDSIADRDHLASRTHAMVGKHHKDMKKIWIRMRALTAAQTMAHKEMRIADMDRLRGESTLRAQGTRLLDLAAKAERKRTSSEVHTQELMAQVLNSVNSLRRVVLNGLSVIPGSGLSSRHLSPREGPDFDIGSFNLPKLLGRRMARDDAESLQETPEPEHDGHRTPETDTKSLPSHAPSHAPHPILRRAVSSRSMRSGSVRPQTPLEDAVAALEQNLQEQQAALDNLNTAVDAKFEAVMNNQSDQAESTEEMQDRLAHIEELLQTLVSRLPPRFGGGVPTAPTQKTSSRNLESSSGGVPGVTPEGEGGVLLRVPSTDKAASVGQATMNTSYNPLKTQPLPMLGGAAARAANAHPSDYDLDTSHLRVHPAPFTLSPRGGGLGSTHLSVSLRCPSPSPSHTPRTQPLQPHLQLPPRRHRLGHSQRSGFSPADLSLGGSIYSVRGGDNSSTPY